MILKFEIRSDDAGVPPVEYFDQYDRVMAKGSIGGSPEPDHVVGIQNSDQTYLWHPMELMAWRRDGTVEVIHAHIRNGDNVFLMSDAGTTIDRLT